MMKVTKRNGSFEDVSFDKVLKRIQTLAGHLNKEFSHLNVDSVKIAQKVCTEIYDGVDTTQLDELASQIAIALYPVNTDYGELASRISISNIHKNTPKKFSEGIEMLYSSRELNGRSIIAEYLYNFVNKNKDIIDKIIDDSADYNIDYFGFKTLEKSYLLKIKEQIIERPQYLFMRVALCIHRDNIDNAISTYHILSGKYYTHATPTLFNSGTINEQLASCFLIAMKDDSIDGIYDTLKECALISKHAGGIGLHIHNIRAKNSYINGTNGTSNGILPMLKVFNDTAKYVDQGGGKRNGSFAIYLEPWHADIEVFLEMKKNHGNEEERARDLFYGLWIPDLFMERVKKDEMWTLMCPHECPNLSDCWGAEFNALYTKYEAQGKGREQIKAQKLWFQILTAQIETGTPYLLYKDACNRKSNQKNLGTIKSSNLCTEIVEYTSPEETAVCNLASISLPAFVVDYKPRESEFVVLFSKDDCKYCKLAEKYLKEISIPYRIIKLNDKKNRQTLYFQIDECFEETVDSMPQMILINKNKIEEKDWDKLNIGVWSSGEDNEDFEEDEYIGGYYNLIRRFRPEYDFKKLEKVVKEMTYNLNKVIDYNYYPVETARKSNIRHRPIGIGVQGLANVFFKMNMPFSSEEARKINRDIFETIYWGAMTESMNIAKYRGELITQYKKIMEAIDNIGYSSDCELEIKNKEKVVSSPLTQHDYNIDTMISDYIKRLNELKKRLGGEPLKEELDRLSHLGSYSSFYDSPLYNGEFQFDLWGVEPSSRYDWNALRKEVVKYGTRNSLLVAPMPTASTSQILGNFECFEPIISNIYLRRVLAGEYVVINKYLVDKLSEIGLWDQKMKDLLILNNGSVKNIPGIPNFIKEMFMTAWEISQKVLIDMAADRGAFICQSQSLNLFMENAEFKKLTSMHFYAWQKGLKTGIYYLRTKAASKALQFTIDPNLNTCESCSG